MTLQQTGRLQIAQHRVQRTLFATEHALAHALQLLGDQVAVHRLRRLGQHRQQGQRYGAGTQLFLEFLQMGFDLAHHRVLPD
jgi:hypothetical protein